MLSESSQCCIAKCCMLYMDENSEIISNRFIPKENRIFSVKTNICLEMILDKLLKTLEKEKDADELDVKEKEFVLAVCEMKRKNMIKKIRGLLFKFKSTEVKEVYRNFIEEIDSALIELKSEVELDII